MSEADAHKTGLAASRMCSHLNCYASYHLAPLSEVSKPLAAVLKAPLRFEPRRPSPAVAAATTNAMIVTYSTKAAPSSFFAKFFAAFQSFTILLLCRPRVRVRGRLVRS